LGCDAKFTAKLVQLYAWSRDEIEAFIKKNENKITRSFEIYQRL